MGVVLEADGRRAAVVVCRASAAVAGSALVLLPVGRHHGHTAAVWRRRRLSSLRLGRLHALVAGRADGYDVEDPEAGGSEGLGVFPGGGMLSSAAAAAAAAITSTQQCSGLSSGLACVDGQWRCPWPAEQMHNGGWAGRARMRARTLDAGPTTRAGVTKPDRC